MNLENKELVNFYNHLLIQKAKAMGYKKLYLMTEHTGYYEKLGWKFLENAPLGRNESNRIYEIILK